MSTDGEFIFRHPVAEDGPAVYRLVADSGGLDLNTPYCYMILCAHFAATCIVAEREGRILGCVLGYRKPEDADTLFLWQVGNAPEARGQGLGRRLLETWWERCSGEARMLETTVTPSNAPSQALFRRFAQRHDVPLKEETIFPAEWFGGGDHEEENLFRIGPLKG